MHKKTKSLQEFYDNQSDTFSSTRQRHWPEFDYILEAIQTHCADKTSLNILELWCGDGRLLTYLENNLSQKITYTGIDISYNLLQLADKKHPHAKRIHKDMTVYLQNIASQEFDVIVGVASFHHLPTSAHRTIAASGIYSGLAYEWVCILTNRCYSTWFKNKFKKEILEARVKAGISLGYYDPDDIMVPRKNSNQKLISKRLYHIFSQKELSKLFSIAGFGKIDHFYVDNTGKKTSHEEDWRNLITVMKKSIWK